MFKISYYYERNDHCKQNVSLLYIVVLEEILLATCCISNAAVHVYPVLLYNILYTCFKINTPIYYNNHGETIKTNKKRGCKIL